jgi:hypothetical protein
MPTKCASATDALQLGAGERLAVRFNLGVAAAFEYLDG